MALRSSLPVYLVGVLGTATVGLGIGYGLGQYTVTGMDPFISVVRSHQSVAWQPATTDEPAASTRLASVSADMNGAIPVRPSY